MLLVKLTSSFSSWGCDVVSRNSIFLYGWARIRQPPCQALVRIEQTPNSIWMAICGTRCYNMVCSLLLCTAPHSQDAVEAMPHLGIDDRKRPTPVRRRFSRTQAGLGSPIPDGRASTSSKNECRREVPSRHPMLHPWSAHLAAPVPSSLASLSSSRAAGTKGCLDLSCRCPP